MRPLFAYCAVLVIAVLIAAPATQVVGEQAPRGSGEIPGQSFLGHYTDEKGEMSIDIAPSDREGEVRVLIVSGGPGKGNLIGGISADGKLRASGMFGYCILFGGCSEWYCNLTGAITGSRITGKLKLVPKSKSGTIIGDIWEKRPSGRH